MVEGPYRPWAELLKRTFQIDVERCDKCGGRLKLRALVMVLRPLLSVVEAHNIERLLRYIGEPFEPPKRAPARDPPYFKSSLLLHKASRGSQLTPHLFRLCALIKQFIEHYLTERFHQGIGSQIIMPKTISSNDNAMLGPIGCRSRLGGLLNYYHRNAT